MGPSVAAVVVAAGGFGIRNPPTAMYCGDAPAPSQLGLAAVPVPGQEWHELQSCDPETALSAP